MDRNPYAPPRAESEDPRTLSEGRALDETSTNVLEYFPARRGTDSSAVAIYALFGPLIIAVFLAELGFGNLALFGAVAFWIFLWNRHRQRKHRPQAVLRIHGGRLRVFDARERLMVDTSLDELLNVALDTKTIQSVQENSGSAVPGLRFIDSVVQAPVDISRIELVTEDGSFFLTEDHLPSIDTTEWFGKIRKLLRRNGWVPADERPRSPSRGAMRR